MKRSCGSRGFGAGLALLALLPAARPGTAVASAESELEAGTAAYAAGSLPNAHAAFERAVQLEAHNFTALRWLSRVESDLGEDAHGEEQRTLFANAVEHARAAVQAAPDSARGHLELAVALGRQAMREGPRTRLALSREIKAEADRAIAQDPGLGRAYHVRAMWNRKIAGLSFIERTAARAVLGGVPKGASMDNAVSDFQKAIELEPGYVNHHLELARTFLELKRKDDARRELEKAIALPPTSSPRDVRYQDEARELLKKLAS
jgi:tetratricopeptide (TPR) repeat protein